MTTRHDHSVWKRGSRGLALAALLALPLAACDTEALLEVEDPDVTRPEALADPANLPALRATVIGDFGVAYGGANQTNGIVVNAGLLSDELYHSGTFGQNKELDQRIVSNTNSNVATATRNIYRAIRSATLGVEAYGAATPNVAAHAEMQNLKGFGYVFLAENYCSAIPFSEVVNGEFEYTAPKSTGETFAEALSAFDEALRIATAAGDLTQQRVARIGKARVLLDVNRFSEAAALVTTAAVPTGFTYNIEYSANTTRQNNGVWGLNTGRREVALSHNEGGVGLDFRTGRPTAANAPVAGADPRVPWSFRAGSAAGTVFMHYFALKYPAQGTSIPLATGVEARLIEAEAALARGASAAYLPIVNALRASAGLTALTDPGSPTARVNQFFRERAFFLFGTAHRLSDMRRLVRQYGRPVDTVYPRGPYTRLVNSSSSTSSPVPVPRAEGVYGADVNMPMPFDELNNPAFKAAAAQCVTTAA